MRYSVGILWSTILAGFVFSFCDVPTTSFFDNPFFSSPYTELIQSTMCIWSNIRTVRSMTDNSYDHDDYNTCVYAIIGQLFCIDNAMISSDADIIPEDILYLSGVMELVKEEATALSVTSVQAQVMQQLFAAIEKKIATLLSQSDIK